MRGRGITYDTGFRPGGKDSRPSWDPAQVAEELRIIAEELHCSAVRITGADPRRIAYAARQAAARGLEVWFSPFPAELTEAALVPFLAECAEAAEQIRAAGASVVFVAGCELSLFGAGFIPGDSAYARMAALGSGDPALWESLAGLPARFNAFLASAAAAVRERFGGPVTYAAGMWEDVDWAPFDLVSVDAYRDASNAGTYRSSLRAVFGHGKPVVVTEFGCCPYRGAAGRGGMGWAIVDHGARPPRLDGAYVRDESEQVRYLRELLEIFEAEGVDTAFWFTFAAYTYPHSEDPARDLDLGSYGVVTLLPDGGRRPREVFHALAEAYR